ncbi:MAG: hypothetical protein MJZ00_05295 [Paludibacteraceae bacterium]|nr:hypothetical protein [Paludibacteraceae bacterium]
MKATRFLWLTAILASLSACDTRDDYFLEHGEEPVVDMTTTNDTMNSEYWDGKRYRIVEVGFGKPDTLNFAISDAYGKECTYEFKLESFPADNERNGVYAEELLYYFGKEGCINGLMATSMNLYNLGSPIDLGTLSDYVVYGQNYGPGLKRFVSSGKVIYSLKEGKNPGMAGSYLHDLIRHATPTENVALSNTEEILGCRLASTKTTLLHDIPFSKEVSARYSLTAKNKIGVSTTDYVVVKIKPNRQPVPEITATCVNSETNEYKITVGGVDPDGHKIEKWSYVFDYIPFELGSKTLTEHHMNGNVGEMENILDGYLYYDWFVRPHMEHGIEEECFYWFTFGMSKEEVQKEFKNKEVDFITPTTKNEVYHVFQSKGEHTISVRCKDEYGLWSDYKTEKIYIE